MAKAHHQQRTLRQGGRHYLMRSPTTLLACGITMILMVCGSMASGNVNMNAEGNHNYTMTRTFPQEKRLHRVASETEIQQGTAVVVPRNGIGVEPEEIPGNSIHMSPTNNFVRNFNNPYKELNIHKRAPNGFIGMRGKKDNIEDDENYLQPANVFDWYFDPLFRQNVNDYDEDLAYGENERRIKKTANAFYGVRGKKILPNYGGNSYSNALNDMVEQLEEERLRERMLQDFIGRLAVATARQNEINKRAPTGFTGLRGKRPSPWNWNDASHPMNDDGNGLESHEKRAPVNSFVGVRGKKDVSNQQDVHQTLFKRSPSESFNGKRRLSDFNKKFVAVRGKKAALTSITTAEDATEGAEERQAQRQHLRYLVNLLPSLVDDDDDYDDGIRNVKRSSSFGGMHGKRSVILSEAIEPITASD